MTGSTTFLRLIEAVSAFPAVRGLYARVLIRRIRKDKLSYVGISKLNRVVQALEEVRTKAVPGAYIEAGVALGGSAILIAKLRQQNRPLHLYDVFGLIPPPGPEDGEDAHERYEVIRQGKSQGIGGELYYGYRDDLIDRVRDGFAAYDIEPDRDQVAFHPGTFEESLYPFEPIAFAHIDCDWFQSVNICIERIHPVLSQGGIMVFDDYKSYSGCRKAVDQFLASVQDMEIVFADKSIGLRKRAKSPQ